MRSGTEVVQTQTNTLGATLTTEQITKLPLVTRDTLWGAVPFLAGVDTTTGPRASTINGLPSGAINISIDGVNTQDNNNRSATGTGGGCGFFSLISPRLDAVEEVTIATAAQGADSAGQGAVQIKFTTRSGTNHYTGSGYFYMRDPRFNSNYWFNNRDRAPDPVDRQGAERSGQGLSAWIPGRRPDSDPGSLRRSRQGVLLLQLRTVPAAQSGVAHAPHSDAAARSRGSSATVARRSIVLNVAAANGQTSTIDPTIKKLLADIYSSTSAGTLQGRSDPNVMDFNYTAERDAAAAVSDVAARLQPHARTIGCPTRATSRSTRAFPDTLNNAEAAVPWIPVAGEPEFESVELEHPGAVDDRKEPRQPVRDRLHRVARVSSSPRSRRDKFAECRSAIRLASPEYRRVRRRPTTTTSRRRRRAARRSSASNPTIDVNDTLTWLKGSHNISIGGSFTHVGLVGVQPDRRAAGQLRHCDRRSGRCDVQDDEFPERLDHEPR